MSHVSQFERERAKRLYAAIMSMQTGTSFKVAYKELEGTPIAQFWYEQAEEITKKWTELIDKRIAELLKPEKAGMIQ